MHPQVPHGAEAFSFWTHVGGAALGVAGLVALLARAPHAQGRAAVAVYGISLIVLFVSSALHHTFPGAPARVKDRLRRLDHAAIYLFIAGTYTPVCLLALPAPLGGWLLGVVWTAAAAGILLKLARPFTGRRVTAALYVALGWAAAPVAPPLWDRFPPLAIGLVAGGGIVYTVGAVVYARRRPDPWPRVVGFHGLWHLFVLVAAALHFAFVYGYVL